MNHLAARYNATFNQFSISPTLTEPGPTIPGIDISRYQDPDVQWGQSQFAWIKASEGLGVDDTYLTNQANAKARGIFTGAYHYLRDYDDPIAQAKLFVGAVGGKTDMGYALDWEEYPHAGQHALAFMVEVHALTGRMPILYSYLNFIETLSPADSAALSPYALWLADLSHGGPHIPAPWKTILFWQYKFGIGSLPDQDLFMGDLTALKALIA